jgi:hypothetical protein
MYSEQVEQQPNPKQIITTSGGHSTTGPQFNDVHKPVNSISDHKVKTIRVSVTSGQRNEEKEKNNNLEAKLEQKNNEIDELRLEMEKSKCSFTELQPLVEDNITEKQCSNDEDFWKGFISDLNSPKNHLKRQIEYLLVEFGTKKPCNRFDVGNSIEFIIVDYINKFCGFKCSELPNAKRVDIDIYNYKQLSIKYSSTGDITLHNSNSSINKDIDMKDTVLLTPNKIYLITNAELCKNNINIDDYIKNTGDSLKLKRAILKELEKKNYPYIYDININHNKSECKNRLCSKIFYSKFIEEYNNLTLK